MQNVVGLLLEVLIVITISVMTWWAIPSITPKGITRLRVIALQHTAKSRIRHWTTNETLDIAFITANLPWFTASKWAVLRVSFAIFGLLYGVYQYEQTSTLGWIVLPLILWFLMRTHMPSLLLYVLQYRKALHQYDINRDLYTLYILLIQDLELQDPTQVKNLYQTMQRLHYFLPNLKRPLQELILHWSDSPEQAIVRFGSQIHTQEAQYFAQVLLDVHRSTPAAAMDILRNRFVGFQSDRITEKQKLRKTRQTILFFVLMACTIAVALNGLMELSHYITGVISNPYNHAGPSGP